MGWQMMFVFWVFFVPCEDQVCGIKGHIGQLPLPPAGSPGGPRG